MLDTAQIVILSALAIGLIYGSIGLLSGFCMMSSLRGWLAEGDGRLVRTYALAMGVGIAASQILAAAVLAACKRAVIFAGSHGVTRGSFIPVTTITAGYGLASQTRNS